MSTSIPKMINNMHRLRDQIEAEVVGQATLDLKGIFSAAEQQLAFQESKFQSLLTKGDQLENIPANIDAANQIVKETLGEIDEFLIGPGQAWADEIIPKMHKAGRDLARANLNVRFLDPDSVKGAFDLVSMGEKGILKTGYNDSYKIMNMVGDDVAEWFRQTMMDAVIEELPIVNKLDKNADTLMARLVESGRIKPLVIKSKTGKIITRSIAQRAEAIARIESGKIINRVHEVKAAEVLGDGAVYRNSNPHDSRTTPICRQASEQKPMTLKQWSESSLGRPPRLNPFHLCRSVLIGGRPAWFDDIPDETLAAQTPLPKTTVFPAGAIKAAQKAKAARAATKAKAAQEKAEAAALALKQAKVSEAKATAFQKIQEVDFPAQADSVFQEVLALASPMGDEAVKGLNDLYAAVLAKKKALKGKELKEVIRDTIEKPQLILKNSQVSGQVDEMLEELGKVVGPEDLIEYKGLVEKAKAAQKIKQKEAFQEAFAAASTVEQKKDFIKLYADTVDDFFQPAELINLEEAIALAASQEAATAYSAGLSQILSGKLGPKKIKTVQKQAKAAGLKAGIPDTEVDLAIAETLKALDAAFTEEQKLFALEYNALVTSKQVPVGDAAEILAKVKAGQLPGKAGAKAKQALETTQQKLSQAAPPVVTPEPSSIPATAPESAFDAIDSKFATLSGRDFTFAREARDLGGAHAKQIYTDPDGSEWMYKPAARGFGFVVHAEEAVYKVQRLLDPKTPEVRYVELDGTAGSIQRLIPNVKGISDRIEDLSAADLAALQREHVLDWLVSNHDGHNRQFLRDADGRLFGVDKGQAYKFLGEDRLDTSYRPNPSDTLYNIMGRAARDGSISLDPEETLKAIRIFEAMDDNVYREWLRPYAEGRRGDAEAFLDLAVQRKQNLRADFESWYRQVLQDPSFRLGEVSAPLPTGAFPPELVETLSQIENAGAQGRVVGFDGDDVEDLSFWAYNDYLDIKKPDTIRSHATMKVTAGVDPKITSWINQFEIEGGNRTEAGLGDLLEEDVFFQKIKDALITVNSHNGHGKNAADFKYNQGKLDPLYAEKPTLESLRDRHPDPDVKAMAREYLDIIEEIDQATVPSGSHSEIPIKTQYLKQFEAEAPEKAPTVKVRQTDITVPERTPDASGRLGSTGKLIRPRDVMRVNFTGSQYNIEWPDGMIVRYRPSGPDNPMAFWGELDIVQMGKWDAASLQKMFDRLEEMGIDARLSTAEDLELMYLKRQGFTLKQDEADSAYKTLLTDTAGLPVAEQVTRHKQYWSNFLGVEDVAALEHYRPQGEREISFSAWAKEKREESAGHRNQYRFDVAEKDIPKNYDLFHSPSSLGESSDSGILTFLKTGILESNGKLMSLKDKLRNGVHSRDESADWDLNRGGGSYAYLRSLPKKDDWLGLYFKKRNYRRLDARHIKTDGRGHIPEAPRRTKLTAGELRKFASSGNEMLFKNGMDLIGELEAVVMESASGRDEAIRLFKAAGWDRLPDGRSIEEVIMLRYEWTRLKEDR